MSKSKKLVFFGTEDFSLPPLERLIKDGWNITAVVTKPDAPAGRNRQIKAPAVAGAAKKAGIKLLQPDKLSDIKNELEEFRPAAGVLVSYGKIIPQDILNVFPVGIINVHPSLLPKYRGPSPIETAILNGDTETGVSLMRLTAGMDEGPVYAQERLNISSDMDAPSLSSKLADMGADLLVERLEPILEGWATPKPQIEADASYSKLLKKSDGTMDFKKSAEQLEREVRAYVAWPKSHTKIHDQEVIVTKVRIAKDGKDGDLVLECSDGWLEVVELRAPSGRVMSGAEFLRGYKKV